LCGLADRLLWALLLTACQLHPDLRCITMCASLLLIQVSASQGDNMIALFLNSGAVSRAALLCVVND
jgi:hypothetical protein